MAYNVKAPTGQPFGVAETAAFRPEIWSTDIMRYRRSNLIAANFTKKISFVGKAGDRIRLPRVGKLGVRSMVPGNPVELQSRTETEWYMYIDRYMESSFAVQDIAQKQANQDLRRIYTEEAGRALAEDIENFILGMRAAVVGYNGGSNHVSNNATLSFAHILSAHLILDKARVPREGRVLIVSPSQAASLFAEDKLIKMDYTGDKPIADIRSGRIGSVLGTPIYVSNHILYNSTTGYKNGDTGSGQPTPGMTNSPYWPTQYVDAQDSYTPSTLTAGYYSALLVHPEWCALAMQKNPSVDADWIVDYQEYHVVNTQLYGAKLYRPDHAVVISSDDDGLV